MLVAYVIPPLPGGEGIAGTEPNADQVRETGKERECVG